MGAPFSQGARPSHKVRAPQQLPTISILQLNFPPPPHMAWNLLHLPAPTADPSSLPTPRPWGDHTLLPQTKAEGTHLGHGGLGVRPLASVWTVGDYPGRHTEVRIKQDFTSVPESSWLRRELHRKVQQTHPSTHLGHDGLGVRPLASVWTVGDHPGRHTEVRIKHDFYFSS